MTRKTTSFSDEDLAFSNEHLKKAYALAGRPRLRGLIQKAVLPQVQPYRDFKLHLVPKNNFTEFTIWRTGKSPEETELQWLVDTFAGQKLKVLDIGANFGLYSLLFSSILDADSQIQAFEPNPEMFARLKRNTQLNGFKNIKLNNFALSDRAGHAELLIKFTGDFASNLGQAFLSGTEAEIDPEAYHKVRVETKALSTLRSAHGADFAKIDVEGHEADILIPFLDKASDAALPRHLQLETVHLSDSADSLWTAMKSRGYERIFETKNNAVYKR